MNPLNVSNINLEDASLDVNTQFGKINFKFLNGDTVNASVRPGNLIYFGKKKNIFYYQLEVQFRFNESVKEFSYDGGFTYGMTLGNARGDGGVRRRKTASVARKKEIITSLSPLVNWIAKTYPELRGRGESNKYQGELENINSNIKYYQDALSKYQNKLREMVCKQIESMGKYSV